MRIKIIKKLFFLSTIITIAIIVIFNLSACTTLGENILGADTFEVTRGDIIQTVSASGYVDSISHHNYSLSTSGKVKYTLNEGDKFSKDDVLFKIDSERHKLLVSQAEENVNISKDSLELARLNYQQALDANHIALQLSQINEGLAEQTTKSAYTTMVDTENIYNRLIASAKIAWEEAEKILAQAIADGITGVQLVQYEANVSNAEANYNAVKAQQNSSLYTAQSGFEQSLLNQSTASWTNLSNTQAAEAQIEITKKNIDQAKKQLKLSEISLELAEMDMDDCTLYAPYDGIVTSSSYSEGEYASLGMPVISIIASDFVVKAEVNETDVVNLEVGQDVEVSLDAYYEHKFSGKITKISPISTNIGGVVSFEIITELETVSGPEILYGFSASLDITTSSVENILYVPIQYVYEEDGRSYVDVLIEDKKTIKTEVTTGTFNYDYIEIKSGLDEGDIVTVSFF